MSNETNSIASKSVAHKSKSITHTITPEEMRSNQNIEVLKNLISDFEVNSQKYSKTVTIVAAKARNLLFDYMQENTRVETRKGKQNEVIVDNQLGKDLNELPIIKAELAKVFARIIFPFVLPKLNALKNNKIENVDIQGRKSKKAFNKDLNNAKLIAKTVVANENSDALLNSEKLNAIKDMVKHLGDIFKSLQAAQNNSIEENPNISTVEQLQERKIKAEKKHEMVTKAIEIIDALTLESDKPNNNLFDMVKLGNSLLQTEIADYESQILAHNAKIIEHKIESNKTKLQMKLNEVELSYCQSVTKQTSAQEIFAQALHIQSELKGEARQTALNKLFTSAIRLNSRIEGYYLSRNLNAEGQVIVKSISAHLNAIDATLNKTISKNIGETLGKTLGETLKECKRRTDESDKKIKNLEIQITATKCLKSNLFSSSILDTRICELQQKLEDMKKEFAKLKDQYVKAYPKYRMLVELRAAVLSGCRVALKRANLSEVDNLVTGEEPSVKLSSQKPAIFNSKIIDAKFKLLTKVKVFMSVKKVIAQASLIQEVFAKHSQGVEGDALLKLTNKKDTALKNLFKNAKYEYSAWSFSAFRFKPNKQWSVLQQALIVLNDPELLQYVQDKSPKPRIVTKVVAESKTANSPNSVASSVTADPNSPSSAKADVVPVILVDKQNDKPELKVIRVVDAPESSSWLCCGVFSSAAVKHSATKPAENITTAEALAIIS